MNKDTNKKKKKIGFTKEEIEKFLLGFKSSSTAYEVHKYCEFCGWKYDNGEPIRNIPDAILHYDSYREQRNNKVFSKGKNKQKIRLGIYLQVEEFPDNGMHYIAYTDGSCDNLSIHKAGGAGYVILKDGEIIKMKNKGFLNTTNNRMEMLAIISVCNSLPEGAYVDIYTDSQYAIGAFIRGGKMNQDLMELFCKSSYHLAGVRFHWVKGHSGNEYNEMADDLAFSAYREICEEYKIPIGIRMNKTH